MKAQLSLVRNACANCGEERSAAELFHKRSKSPGWCKRCRLRKGGRDWAKNHPEQAAAKSARTAAARTARYVAKNREAQRERVRDCFLKRNYGISAADYERILISQNGVCAVCRATTHDGAGRRLHVDHDHTSGKVRGLLCTNCNAMLGQGKDSPLVLRAAADYLERSR